MAKGVITIGDIAIGGIAIGGLAQALLAIRGHDIDLEFARLLERWVSDAPMGQ